MANENKNINELVSDDLVTDDDDPTAELEILNFRQFESDEVVLESDEVVLESDGVVLESDEVVLESAENKLESTDTERESDSNTYGFSNDSDTSQSQSIPELKSDLERRTQTIGRLQYDIEQLRAKWLGLETEIKAREEIVNNLLGDVDELKGAVTRKEKLLKKRDKTIKSLKSELRQGDEAHALLEQKHAELKQQLDAQSSSDADNVSALEVVKRELEEMRSSLETAQDEIAALKTEIAERDETHGLLQQNQAELAQQLEQNVVALSQSELELEQTRSNLETAQQRIALLRSENGQQGEAHGLLEQLHTELERQLAETAATLEKREYELEKLRSTLLTVQDQSAAELVLTQQTSTAAVNEAKAQVSRAEKYADTLRYKLQDFTESQSRWSQERDRLNETIEQLMERNWFLSERLEAAGASTIELQAALRQQHDDHEQEIRTLRFELGKAKDTVTETDELNSQLASDLMDSRSFKQELERTLRENDTAAQKRVEELEKQLSELTETTAALEQKLDTKSNTIGVLLGELAKKSEQIESIGEIENVIQEIDDRMSERFDDQEQSASPGSDVAQESADRDRITRVLIGSIGDQVLRFPLFKNRLTIGRSEDNDIQLKTTFVSRSHAVVMTEGDSTRVIDWDSKNGVFVNSERVKEHFLSNGDVVAIGNIKFRYEERPKRDA